jgi:hypothetical protein
MPRWANTDQICARWAPPVAVSAWRIAEGGDAADLGDVHRLHEHGAAQVFCLRRYRVGVVNRDIRLPVRRQRAIRQSHEAGDASLAAVEDSVAAVLGSHVAGRPAEDLAVEALCVVGVRRSELVPDEDALWAWLFALGLVGADVCALRIGDDPDASDLAHLERAGGELPARALRLLDRLVQVLDPDVAEPVRWRCSLHGLAEAAVALSA